MARSVSITSSVGRLIIDRNKAIDVSPGLKPVCCGSVGGLNATKPLQLSLVFRHVVSLKRGATFQSKPLSYHDVSLERISSTEGTREIGPTDASVGIECVIMRFNSCATEAGVTASINVTNSSGGRARPYTIN